MHIMSNSEPLLAGMQTAMKKGYITSHQVTHFGAHDKFYLQIQNSHMHRSTWLFVFISCKCVDIYAPNGDQVRLKCHYDVEIRSENAKITCSRIHYFNCQMFFFIFLFCAECDGRWSRTLKWFDKWPKLQQSWRDFLYSEAPRLPHNNLM